MKDKSHLDIKGMQERVDEQGKIKAEESRKILARMTEKKEERQAKINELFAKAILSDREENQSKKVDALEAEKLRAVKEVEDRYEESHGIKSNETKDRDAAYASMLSNLKGLGD